MPHKLIEHFGERYWAIQHDAMHRLSADVETGRQMKTGRLPKVKGSIAVIPIEGPLTPKGGFFSTSMQSIGAVFDSAIASDKIGAVVLAWDSPGGTVTGTQELADKIFNARGAKPIVSVVSPQMASAALWIGSTADQVIIEPSAETGSHGVWSAHVDISEALEKDGIKVTLTSAGKHKVEGNPWEPASEEFLAHEKETVDRMFDEFTETLARNYGVTKSHVLAEFGQGRMLSAKQAEAAGMVHGIDTLDSVLNRLQSKAGKGGRSADDDTTGLLLEESCGLTVEQLRLQNRKKRREEMLTSE